MPKDGDMPPMSVTFTTEEKEMFAYIEDLIRGGGRFLGSLWGNSTGSQCYEIVVIAKGKRIALESLRPFPKLVCQGENSTSVVVDVE